MKIGLKTREDKELEAILKEELPMAPPETHYLSERYVVELPISNIRLNDPWKLRVQVLEVLEKQLGDEVQLTSMKVKKPRLIAKSKARLLKREPCVRMYVTVKF